MANNAVTMHVQICYARPGFQVLRNLTVAEGTRLHEAIQRAGITKELSQIDWTTCKVGIHGKLKAMDTELRDGDRIEIYRPLLADPKEARRKRAKKKN